MQTHDFPMRGYDTWRTAGPPESYDERSECEQAGCGHERRCRQCGLAAGTGGAYYCNDNGIVGAHRFHDERVHVPGCPDYQEEGDDA